MNFGTLLSKGLALLVFGTETGHQRSVQLNIAITGRCNIRCIHCYIFSPLANTTHTGGIGWQEKLETLHRLLNRWVKMSTAGIARTCRRNHVAGNKTYLAFRSWRTAAQFFDTGHHFRYKKEMDIVD